MKFYAGIGSRETPEPVLRLMTYIAQRLYMKKYICRTGGAHGADDAFLQGATPDAEVYLPWVGYNHHRHNTVVVGDDLYLRTIARDHHPRWNYLSEPAKKLMTRNVAQILGRTDPINPASEFVICWTPNGAGGGGTGQAIRVARTYGVPVYDMARREDCLRIKELCR